MGMNKNTRMQQRILRRRRLALALAAAMAVPPVVAQSLPDSGTVVSGAASIAPPSGSQLTVTQTSTGAIIDWGSFSIGSGYGVTFDQQAGAASVTLNRVVGYGYGYGPGASIIDGSLSANGSVFIINPAGITFGGGAQVNVGALVASTMDISNANFDAGVASGSFQFEPMTDVDSQAITLDPGADITTSAGGTVALIGRQVFNQGTITAPGGSVVFGSAENVTLDFEGDGLTMLTIQGPGIARPGSIACPSFPCPGPVLPTLANSGTINADGGQVLMRTAASSLGGGDILNVGTLRAQSLVSRNGRIELTTDGLVSLGYWSPSADAFTGELDVSGQSGADGGAVLVRAGDFVMYNNDASPANPTDPASAGSLINASGALRGGVVDIVATNQARVFSLSSILADGAAGSGGRVSLVAGNTELGARARISANGAAGAGGRIDVSGNSGLSLFGLLSATGSSAGGIVNTSTLADAFDLRGLRVEAGAPAAAGTWTMSAPYLTVVSGSEAGELDSMVGGTSLQDTEINHALSNGTSVVLRSAGDVYIDDAQIQTDSGLDLLFAIDADGGIGGSGFSIVGMGGRLDMRFNADAAGTDTGFAGISFGNASLDSNGGSILMYGQSDAANGFASSYASGIRLDAVDLATGGGNLLLRGASTGADAGSDDAGVLVSGGSVNVGNGGIRIVGEGAQFVSGVRIGAGALQAGAGGIDIRGRASGSGDGIVLSPYVIAASGGNILLDGRGGGTGVSVSYANLDSGGGDIVVRGEGGAGNGVDLFGSIDSGGGRVSLDGRSVQAVGLVFQAGYAGGIASAGGDISLSGAGATGGTVLIGNGYGTTTLDSGGGAIGISGSATGAGAVGVALSQLPVLAGIGDISVTGLSAAGTSIAFSDGSSLTTTSGDISVAGVGADVGLLLDGGVTLATDSGGLDLRGRGTAADASGLVIGNGVGIATSSGGITLAGEGGSGAGVALGANTLLDAGSGMVVLRAGNDGSSDAVRLSGAIRAGAGVNLRPGGVDPNGLAYDRIDDGILLGSGVGFALDAAELATIDAPELVIGSRQHAGAIRVSQDIVRNGNLTLQNQGGSGGIDLQAGVDVGGGTLALLSGGSVAQTASAPIHAHSLLAQAGGDVLLGLAQNDVASTTLAGQAGGDFQFQDATDLAIGSVSASGFDAATGAMAGEGSSGINAAGDLLIRNLAGDLTLGAGLAATNIDLVIAGRLQNPVNAGLSASGDWRVWASTWEGESRGGLGGSGDLPNLYNCAYLGACGVTVASGDNHFIYVQQPTATIAVDSWSREYGLANPAFTYTVSGAVLGDTLANVASGVPGTNAGIGSDVGQYPILGNFTSNAGYRLQILPGVLTVNPATLLFTADAVTRYLGMPNPPFGGAVTGFRNGDTLESVFGGAAVWSSPAGPLSPVGYYAINGGTTAKNYVFAQAPSNATALHVIPLPNVDGRPVNLVHETVDTYVYDRNLGTAPVCAINATLDDQPLASAGDALAMEWSKVRTRPNLTNCFESQRRNGCGDF
jgi:filamentous hemagglutinin family protein